MTRVKIEAINTYLPDNVIDNAHIENQPTYYLKAGMLERIFGSKKRHYAHCQEQVSDLACKAALPIVQEYGGHQIDYLIFAAACADVIEPATANIIQYKLGLTCPVMDIKNACNSFVTAIMVAAALIETGKYKTILLVNGEKLSDAVKRTFHSPEEFRRSVAGLTFGDAGAAALLTASTNISGLYYHNFKTIGEHWNLCTILGGGSLYPHDVSRNYFEGDVPRLHQVVRQEGTPFIKHCFAESGWSASEIDLLFTHQVAKQAVHEIAASVNIPAERCINTFAEFGNTAAASIPLAIHQALKDNRLKRGMKVAIVGVASGVSISLQLMIW